MPRKHGYVTEPEQRLGPARIRAALRAKYVEIEDKCIFEVLQSLLRFRQELNLKISASYGQDALSAREKMSDMHEIQQQLGRPISQLEYLCTVIWHEAWITRFKDTAAAHWEKSDGMSKEELIKEFVRPHELRDSQLGDRLQQSIMDSKAAIELLYGSVNPLDKIVYRFSDKCLKEILSELARLQILGVCERCGGSFFPARPRKRFCSIDYEGKNCSGNARSQRSRRKAN